MLMRAGFAGEIQNSGHLLKWNPCGYCAMYFGFKHLQERLEHGLVPNKTFAKKKKERSSESLRSCSLSCSMLGPCEEMSK